MLCALIVYAHSRCTAEQLGFVALCELWELGQNSDPLSNVSRPFLNTSRIKAR